MASMRLLRLVAPPYAKHRGLREGQQETLTVRAVGMTGALYCAPHADVFESLCYEPIEMADDPVHDQARVLRALPDGDA